MNNVIECGSNLDQLERLIDKGGTVVVINTNITKYNPEVLKQFIYLADECKGLAFFAAYSNRTPGTSLITMFEGGDSFYCTYRKDFIDHEALCSLISSKWQYPSKPKEPTQDDVGKPRTFSTLEGAGKAVEILGLFGYKGVITHDSGIWTVRIES